MSIIIAHVKCQIMIYISSSKVGMFDLPKVICLNVRRAITTYFNDFQLKKSEVEDLYKLYAADFEMFGYSPLDFISIAQPG